MLLAGFFLSYSAYNLAIKKTIRAKLNLIEIKKEIKNLDELMSKINQLKKKNANYDNLVSRSYSKESIQSFILNHVAEYCKTNNLIICEYPQPHIFQKDDYVIETNKIVLKGGFLPMLKLVYNIEQHYRVGKVTSVKYYKSYNIKKRKNELYAEIYLQTIKTFQNEKN